MANLLYCLPTDIVTANASIVGTTADGTYPATNLGDLDPAVPAKLTGTSGNWVFDFGSAQRVDVVAIIHHNLTAGLNVQIQGNATNAWGAPTLAASITIPAFGEDGQPANPFLDLTGVSGYSTSGFRFWRLLIGAASGANVAIGEFLLVSNKRTLTKNIRWGAEETEEHPVIEHETAHGVTRVYDLGVRRRRLRAELFISDANLALFRTLHRSAKGRVRPFLVVPNPSVNDAWFVRFDAASVNRQYVVTDRSTFTFGLEELSRGLVL